uniref:Immediate early response 3-interacting protein 1 n=1 Tax=Phlebotomus papatasi TaxID=29031 RepID=A0A1B0GP98_PHLPP
MFTLWNLIEASLLCLNAVCILHEERFLAKIGWGANANVQGFGEPPTVKTQILNLIRSIRTVVNISHSLKVPYLHQIDEIDATISQIEIAAYKLDAYTQQLEAKFKSLTQKK